ncbi:MAG: alpha-mannosidase [Clostridia bacterium]|nr:alpha-mannosidase [Clostridia bacterium]
MAYNFRSQMEMIEATIPRLYREVYVPVAEVDMTVYRTPEPVSFRDKLTGIETPVKKGDVWGSVWECGWFHITGTVPESAKGKQVVLYLDAHSELCVVDNDGVPVLGLSSGSCIRVQPDFGCFGIRKRVYPICDCAKGGEKLDIWADAGCNYISEAEHPVRGKVGEIEFADICIYRENVKQLFYDFFLLYDLLQNLPEDSARYHRIRQSLFDASCRIFSCTDEEVEEASTILKKELDKKGGDADLSFTAIGHSHIDLAWLWPIRETKRKGARTFSNAIHFMEKYPEYMFGASQPQLYQWVKEDYPELYEQVKQKIKEGRWETQGAMWVEPDANVTGGESFVRQFLYGKRFFRDEFDKDMKILWLPDVFGYSAALPQILKKSGVPYFLTIKLGWGNRHNQHPHNTFKWQGIDGSEVLAHMPPENDYSSFAIPSSLRRAEREYKDKCVCDEGLILYGIGDGGGGPGRFHLEMMKREKNLSGLPPVKQGFAVDFFDRLAENQEKYATYVGELYFEMHQGTYTTQARNKKYNRKMEKLLREAEFASIATGSTYPKEKLDEIWKEVLLYQFHDILPGSSIKRVYDESLARYAVLYDETEAIVKKAYGEGEYAINSLSWDRCGWEKIDGKWYYLITPAMGSTELKDGIASKEVPVSDCGVLDNDCVRVFFDEDGSLLSVYDKKADREILRDKSNIFTVYHDEGDAWDFSESYRSQKPKYFELIKAEAFHDGPVKGVRQEYVFGESKLWQTISITDGSPVVTFDTKIDWKERAKMLRTSFDTTIVTSEVTCDIQYGSIKRNTHENTSWDVAKFEICAHKYADLSDATYGVALMNDCKYGYYVKNGVMDLSLLRSAMHPGERKSSFRTDTAIHTFKYALYPHEGCLKDSDVLKKSYELNQDLWVGGKVEQMFTISNPDIIVESVKKAEDSDSIIVRMYETKGGCAETAIHFTKPVKSAYLVDMMEENEKKIDLNKIPFHGFEIVTVKVTL